MSKISQLSEQQTEALRRAMFGGMTEQEAEEYQQRSKTIGELVNRFAVFTSGKLP
ncbi:MAG TPA: hypothetical protein VF123_19950 [Candidatus Sulfotelmatobacter sp.]